MTSDVPLDYAVFQLSPKRSRCELFVSYDGTMEKLASGLVKPFVTNLKVAEEQVALAVKSIKLEVERYQNEETWFTKGTLERFVRFVTTPEVLETVNTFDAELSQLESARRIYSQGAGGKQSTGSRGDGMGATAAPDATKKELLRAIDVRLEAVKQDLTTACSHASVAGFNPETISELQHFADHFGAHRLSEACRKFISLSHSRPDLFLNPNPPWNSSSDKNPLRSSVASDMSLDNLSDNEQPHLSTSHRDENPTTTSSTTESDNTTPTLSSSGKPQLTRRLSVQERISLFESKQKDHSPSSSTPSSASIATIKPEIRRLSSDVNSSSDKAVLRRWSGASDMSIDASSERKDSDSNANTPTPSSSNIPSFPQRAKDQDGLKAEEGAKDNDSKDSKLPNRPKFGAHSSVTSGGGSGRGESELEEPALCASGSKIPSFPGRSSDNVAGSKDQQHSGGGVRSKEVSFGKGEDFVLDDQLTPGQSQFKSQPVKSEHAGAVQQNLSEEKVKGGLGGGIKQQDSGKNLGRLDAQGKVAENEELRSHSGASQRRTIELTLESAAAEVKSESLNLKEGEVEKPRRKDSQPFEKQSESFSMQTDISGSLRLKFQAHGPASEQAKKSGGRREGGGGSGSGSSQLGSVDQAQRVRHSKVNQGLNDELKMKANELEKLFAEHKLRGPVDQPGSAQRTRPAEQLTVTMFESEPTATSVNMDKFDSTPLMKTIDNQNYDVTPKHSIHSLGFSDDSRGKLYEKYTQKRDAKLREDWGSRRAEKEAKMIKMLDTLEKSQAEMKTKLSGSADKRSPAHDAHRRAEKLRSFDARSAMKRDQPFDSFISDEDENQAEFLRKKLSETFLGDGSSRSVQSKRVFPSKSAASPTPRNSSIPVPRSSGKAPNSAVGRRKLNSDNPLAHSVPNFSDLRKENTRPSPAASKPARPQVRNHARKKSISEELPLANEEKPRRPHSLRKSIASPMELNDSRNSDDVDTSFIPSIYDIKNDHYDKFAKDVESMSIGFGIGIGRSKASALVEAMRNGEDFDDANFMEAAKEEDEEGFGKQSADMDNGKGRLSPESDKSANSGYENHDAFRFSQAGPPNTELPTSMPSIYRTMGSIQDSPSESPGSWNLRVNNPFSFSHEISDMDASDSPIGSPASWNFHTLGQADVEASRMRKKWGAAQKPIVGSDSSHSMSRKDVTKGLKRFLKFGRKNRPSESLADWISATTSEGDDDTEDGREPANRSSEDLRKSRMGFSHSHHSDDGFNESDILNEQAAPKSFFSLSNFRSKGSDSKLR